MIYVAPPTSGMSWHPASCGRPPLSIWGPVVDVCGRRCQSIVDPTRRSATPGSPAPRGSPGGVPSRTSPLPERRVDGAGVSARGLPVEPRRRAADGGRPETRRGSAEAPGSVRDVVATDLLPQLDLVEGEHGQVANLARRDMPAVAESEKGGRAAGQQRAPPPRCATGRCHARNG